MPMIRKGTIRDITQITDIYERILEQEEQGIVTIGWIRGVYPTRQTALDALEAEELFVMIEHEAVVAAARINQVQVPEYKDACWRYTDALEEQIMVLHTLVVDPICAGKGYGTKFVRFYEQYALEHNCLYLRMDTQFQNLTARRMYGHLGYWEAGVVSCVFHGIADVRLVCLEKKLELID